MKPFLPNSWVDTDSRTIGYEILFNKYFYTYTLPRPTHAISLELEELEQDVRDLLSEIMQ